VEVSPSSPPFPCCPSLLPSSAKTSSAASALGCPVPAGHVPFSSRSTASLCLQARCEGLEPVENSAGAASPVSFAGNTERAEQPLFLCLGTLVSCCHGGFKHWVNSSLGTLCPACTLLCSHRTTFLFFPCFLLVFFPLRFVLLFSAPVLERWELCGAVGCGDNQGALPQEVVPPCPRGSCAGCDPPCPPTLRPLCTGPSAPQQSPQLGVYIPSHFGALQPSRCSPRWFDTWQAVSLGAHGAVLWPC